MIGDNIKSAYESKYIQSVLTEDSKYIVSEQKKLINRIGLVKSGKLLNSLSSNITVKQQGDKGAIASIEYIGKIRLLDIKSNRRKTKSYKLYNKILYGVLYNRTVAKIAFGYSNEVIKKLQREDTKIVL